MSLHSHKASEAELQFEPGSFPCPTSLPWVGPHLNLGLERTTETVPGTRKDELQREGQTAYGREVTSSWENQSGRLPGRVGVWRS